MKKKKFILKNGKKTQKRKIKKAFILAITIY